METLLIISKPTSPARRLLRTIPGARSLYQLWLEPDRIVRAVLPLPQYRLWLFYQTFGYIPDLTHPVTFNEKVLYKLIFDRRPILGVFADKYAVRKYVRSKLGSECRLPELYGAFDSIADISSAKLPDQFVVKPSHASGLVRIFRRGDPRTDDHLRYLARDWLAFNFYARHKEWAYSLVPPMILFEELLLDSNDIPPDYKFLCYHGEPIFVDVHIGRYKRHFASFYDMKWKQVPGTCGGVPNIPEPLPKPRRFEQMRECAKALASETDFVRVDLYNVNDEVYFGELTNYPSAGLDRFQPQSLDTIFGRPWHVPRRYVSSDLQENSTPDLTPKEYPIK